MIAKKVRNPKKSSSKGTRIQRLVDYIRAPERKDGQEKNVYDGSRGFVSQDKQAQVAEMQALAHAAVRSKDPVNHYVISWKEGERPSPKQVERAVDIALEELKMKDHQVVYALHRDTQHSHLHLVVNRVHPETEKVNPGRNDYDALDRAVARIVHEQKWERHPNARYRVNAQGEFERNHPKEKERQPSPPKQDREVRTGLKSAERIAIEVGAKAIKAARTWRDVHENLAKEGMRYERKGSGAIVRVNETPVKASVVGREYSLKNLEKSLGSLKPSSKEQTVAKRAPELLHPEKPPQALQKASQQEQKKQELAGLRKQHHFERKAFTQQNQAKHEQLLNGQDWKGRGKALNQARSELAKESKAALAQLQEKHAHERQAFSEKWKPQEQARPAPTPERETAPAQERAQDSFKPGYENTRPESEKHLEEPTHEPEPELEWEEPDR